MNELNYSFILLGLSPSCHGGSPSTGVNNVYQNFISLKSLNYVDTATRPVTGAHRNIFLGSASSYIVRHLSFNNRFRPTQVPVHLNNVFLKSCVRKRRRYFPLPF